MTRNNARIIAKYLREAGWSEVTALRQELAASKARVQEMGRHNATEAEHFRAICRRIDDWVSIMTTGHAALSDKTNALGRWRGVAAPRRSAGPHLPLFLPHLTHNPRSAPDRHAPLVDIEPLHVAAYVEALGTRMAKPTEFLGFHLASDFDLREIGLLYYVLASSENLGESLQRAARFSAITNEGISLCFRDGDQMAMTFTYVGVDRHSDRHQIEFWVTSLARICRQLTNRHLIPTYAKVIHHREGGAAELPRSQRLHACLQTKDRQDTERGPFVVAATHRIIPVPDGRSCCTFTPR
jgi:hypothetical protein